MQEEEVRRVYFTMKDLAQRFRMRHSAVAAYAKLLKIPDMRKSGQKIVRVENLRKIGLAIYLSRYRLMRGDAIVMETETVLGLNEEKLKQYASIHSGSPGATILGELLFRTRRGSEETAFSALADKDNVPAREAETGESPGGTSMGGNPGSRI